MNISIISETIQPTDLKTILNACSKRYLIAIFFTQSEVIELSKLKDLIFVGTIDNIPYKLIRELGDCEAGIAFVGKLTKNKYAEYKHRCLYDQQDYEYENRFTLTEKYLERECNILEIAIDQDYQNEVEE